MYLYAYDSYDLTAFLNPDGSRKPDDETNLPGFQMSYSPDWTGLQLAIAQNVPGAKPGSDAPNQVQYRDPPNDHTMLTACTYHAIVARTTTCPVIFTSGTVKPMNTAKFYNYGWDIANH